MAANSPGASERALLAERLAILRRVMEEGDDNIKASLLAWMQEVEAQLDGIRAVVEYAASTAERAAQDSFGMTSLG